MWKTLISRPTFTGLSETKIMAYVIALSLHLDAFRVSPQALAQEMGVQTVK